MPIIIFSIAVLIISAVFHEYAHGWMAYKLGDNTAKYAGRLTLNPLYHLDPVGSILLPALLIMSHSPFFIAWAKPVPYNPYNLRDQKYGDFKVALSGPLTNILIAILFGSIARIIGTNLIIKSTLIMAYLGGEYDYLLSLMHNSLLNSIFVMSIIICFINLLLAIFNLIPIPPLDGSKIVSTFLPLKLKTIFYQLEPYGLFLILFFMIFGLFKIIWPIIIFLLFVLVGY